MCRTKLLYIILLYTHFLVGYLPIKIVPTKVCCKLLKLKKEILINHNFEQFTSSCFTTSVANRLKQNQILTHYNLDKLAGQYCTMEAMDCRRGVIDRRYHTFNNLDCRRSIEEGCI